MPLFKFRIYWEEDDNIYRDIAIQNGQNFHQFHEAILNAFEFDKKHSACFYQSNDNWKRGKAISSEVLVNKKDAEALSMIKTPVSALVSKPDEKFVYTYDPAKNWTFHIELIGLEKEVDSKKEYPYCFRKEGIAPVQTGIRGLSNEKMVEIEEKYDLNKEDMDDQGFGDDEDAGATDDNETIDSGGDEF